MATESPIDGKRLQFVSGFIGKNLIQKLRLFMRKLTRYKTEITMVMVAIFSEIDNFYKKINQKKTEITMVIRRSCM